MSVYQNKRDHLCGQCNTKVIQALPCKSKLVFPYAKIVPSRNWHGVFKHKILTVRLAELQL